MSAIVGIFGLEIIDCHRAMAVSKLKSKPDPQKK